MTEAEVTPDSMYSFAFDRHDRVVTCSVLLEPEVGGLDTLGGTWRAVLDRIAAPIQAQRVILSLEEALMQRRRFLAASAIVLAGTTDARSQQPTKIHRIGQLGPGPSGCQFAPHAVAMGTPWQGLPLHPFEIALRHGLAEAGFVEGRNVTIERRCFGGPNSDVAVLARQLASLPIDAFIGWTTQAIDALKEAAPNRPIVFVAVPDPVAAGYVKSLGRPGGNLTGISAMQDELTPKRIELIREVVPQSKSIAMLSDGELANKRMASEAHRVGKVLGIDIREFPIDQPSQLPAMLSAIHDQRLGALLLGAGGMFMVQRHRIAEMAIEKRLPTACLFYEYVEAGCLMSYGPNYFDMTKRAGGLLARILEGANASELAVEQPTLFELVINLRTARALDITIPSSILARADRLVE